MTRSPRLSVVIPVYNEESIVREACLELMDRLDERGWDYELLLTENGSRDRTVELLRALAAERRKPSSSSASSACRSTTAGGSGPAALNST